MKKSSALFIICLALLIASLPPGSQAQESEGYSFFRGPTGPQVCIGNWTPPSKDYVSGYCDGQVLDVSQFGAVSSRMSAERLDMAIQYLQSIDSRLAANNAAIERLINATVSAKAATSQQDTGLRSAIRRRFDAVPAELLANESFRQEIAKLRQDILREVDSSFQQPPARSTK